MSKIIMEFTLPEDNEDFELARNGVKYKIVIEEFYNWIRSKYKYTDDESVTIEELRTEFLAILEQNEVDLF